MARNAADQKKLNSIRQRIREIAQNQADDVKSNLFLRVAFGVYINESLFLLREIDKLEGKAVPEEEPAEEVTA